MEYIDFPMIDKFNAVGGAFVLVVTYFFGEHWYLFAAYLVLNILDYVTGMAKGTLAHAISSRAGMKGIVKKLMSWVMLIVGFGLTPILNGLGDAIGADVSAISPLIGYYLLATMIVNEVTSIFENLVEMGVQVPSFLIKSLKVAGKLITAPAQTVVNGFDGSLDIDPGGDEEDVRVHLDTPKEKLIEKDVVTLKIHTIHDEE